MRGALLVAFCAQIAQGIFVVLFIVFVARRLDGGAGEIGLLRGVQAIGAIAAAVLLATSRRRPRPGGLVAAASAAFGLDQPGGLERAGTDQRTGAVRGAVRARRGARGGLRDRTAQRPAVRLAIQVSADG